MKDVPAEELVEALFDVIVEEARRNKPFARRLLSVYPQSVVARIETGQQRKATFDASAYHAVNILRNHGEAMLRGRLSSLKTREQLREVATRSGLRLTGKGARRSASKSDIVDAIVEAARQYVAQREASTASGEG